MRFSERSARTDLRITEKKNDDRLDRQCEVWETRVLGVCFVLRKQTLEPVCFVFIVFCFVETKVDVFRQQMVWKRKERPR